MHFYSTGIPDIYCPNEQISLSMKEANEYIRHNLANDHWLEKLNKLITMYLFVTQKQGENLNPSMCGKRLTCI